MKPDAPIETELVGILESFCAGLADRDAEAVMRLFGPDPEAVVSPRRNSCSEDLSPCCASSTVRHRSDDLGAAARSAKRRGFRTYQPLFSRPPSDRDRRDLAPHTGSRCGEVSGS